MKKLIALGLVMALALSTIACGSQAAEDSGAKEEAVAEDTAEAEEPAEEAEEAEEAAEPEETGEKILIGMTNNSLADSFAIKNKAYFEENLAARGYDVIATVDDDVTKRASSIETMVSKGAAAIIVIEGSIFDIESVLREAHDAGVKIISFTAGYDEEFVDLYVSGDDALQARQATDEMVKYMGEEGSIVEIINDVGEMIRIRKEAMHEYIAEKYPGITVDYSMVYAWPDYYADIYSKMEALLQAHPEPGEITGVFATFDGVGLAAAAAIRDAGLQDYITVVGICGDDATWDEMQIEGSPFKATIAQSVPDMCDCALDGMEKILNGETIDDPCPIVDAVVVDQTNFKEWAGIE